MTINTKYDLVNFLIRNHGLRSYLEVASPFTGCGFDKVTGNIHKERIFAPWKDAREDDGEPVTYAMESTDAFLEIIENGRRYDLIFVDSIHTFTRTAADILFALDCLTPAGFIVVHDCNPPDRWLTREFDAVEPGEAWCGDVYKAIIALRLFRSDITVHVVDVDYGCGVIRSAPSGRLVLKGSRPEDVWRWEFFDRNRSSLLNLITVDQFMEMYPRSR